MLVNKYRGDPNLVHGCRPGYREPMIFRGRLFVRHRGKHIGLLISELVLLMLIYYLRDDEAKSPGKNSTSSVSLPRTSGLERLCFPGVQSIVEVPTF